jgi:ArsR family transcriptional regulator
MNTRQKHLAENTARTFHLIGQTSRLEILLAIGSGEACVCHLEAWLGYRQATISQQLMLLRDAGLVVSRREGKHIFYSIKDPAVIDSIARIARLEGAEASDLERFATVAPLPNCSCPLCTPAGEEGPGEDQTASPSHAWKSKTPLLRL